MWKKRCFFYLFRPSQHKMRNCPRPCSCPWLSAWWRKWSRRRRSKQRQRWVEGPQGFSFKFKINYLTQRPFGSGVFLPVSLCGLLLQHKSPLCKQNHDKVKRTRSSSVQNKKSSHLKNNTSFFSEDFPEIKASCVLDHSAQFYSRLSVFLCGCRCSCTSWSWSA